MAKQREFEGKDLAEALARASRALDIPERDVHYKLLEGGRRGILGFGAKNVRILAEVPSEKAPAPVSLEEVLAEGSKPILEVGPPEERPSKSKATPADSEAAAEPDGEREGRRSAVGGGRGGRKRGRGGASARRGRRGGGKGQRRGTNDEGGEVAETAATQRRERKRSGGRQRNKAARTSAAGRDAEASRDRAGNSEDRNRSPNRRQRGRRRASSSRRPEASPSEPQAPPSDEHLDALVETTRRMTALMGMQIGVTAEMGDSGAQLLLDGDDHDLLLDKDAELLHAIQFLLNRMSRRAWPGIGRIQVTCPGFRRRRDDDLISEIKEVASQVARTGEAKKLHPMNPYERRLVHLTIREYRGLATESEGSGFMKVITVSRDESDEGA